MKSLAKLSSRLRSSSSMVVPFPIQTSFTSNLKTLLSSLLAERPTSCNDDDHRTNNCLTVSFFARALDALVATQKLAHESLAKSAFLHSDREAVERYLDGDNIDLLAACNGAADKLDNVSKYVESLRLALRCLQGSSSTAAVARANKLLDSSSCQITQEMTTKSYTSSFKKLSDNTTKNRNHVRSELEEILDGSSVVTSTICEILESSLSLKLKHRRPNKTTSAFTTVFSLKPQQLIAVVNEDFCSSASSYSSWLISSLQELRNRSIKKETKRSLQVRELQETLRLAQELRSHQDYSDDDELRVRVEELQRSCDELENGVKVLEGKVKEVYRHLMSVRMGLLGKLSSMA